MGMRGTKHKKQETQAWHDAPLQKVRPRAIQHQQGGRSGGPQGQGHKDRTDSLQSGTLSGTHGEPPPPQKKSLGRLLGLNSGTGALPGLNKESGALLGLNSGTGAFSGLSTGSWALTGLGSESEDHTGRDWSITALLVLDVESGALSGVNSGTASIEASGEANSLGKASVAMTREAACIWGPPTDKTRPTRLTRIVPVDMTRLSNMALGDMAWLRSGAGACTGLWSGAGVWTGLWSGAGAIIGARFRGVGTGGRSGRRFRGAGSEMRWLSTREAARGDKSSTVTDASFYSESWKHALYALKVKPKKTARIRKQLHAITDCTLPSRNNPPRETEIITHDILAILPFIPHYQQAHHVGYTSCTSFGHHMVSLWLQSLPLDYSGSIAIPAVKYPTDKEM